MISFERVAPVFPVRSVARALDRYRALGFTAEAYDEAGDGGDPVYGFLQRGAIHLHLARVDALDPLTNTSACYVYVSDANALYEEWRALGIEGRLVPPADTQYGLRELAYVDPDGNLLRIGSEL
jgi:catechol 2,3-dioxygenase-like lactoylglutathione lyase family enzyme